MAAHQMIMHLNFTWKYSCASRAIKHIASMQLHVTNYVGSLNLFPVIVQRLDLFIAMWATVIQRVRLICMLMHCLQMAIQNRRRWATKSTANNTTFVPFLVDDKRIPLGIHEQLVI